jgi:hypothetical protein
VNRGAPCTPGGSPSTACSHAANPSSRTTSFTCTADVTAGSDGDWNVCAMAADSAVPDNASGTNQFAQATSNNANISTPLCGHVVLDRTPPAVTAHASRSAVAVGDLVTFSAAATDAGSGTGGTYDWNFGDNTPHGAGASATHTYTQAGTYVATATTTDRAGNRGQATTTVTVAARATPGGGTTTNPGGGTTTDPGGTTTTPGGTPTTPGTKGTATASGDGVVTTAPSAAAVSRQSGGGGTQRAKAGGLTVVAPKRLTLTKTRKKLPLVLTVNATGKVDVSLSRSGRIVAKGGAKIRRAGTIGFSLKLPKKPKSGRHALKIVFRPTSGRAVTKTLTVTFAKAKRATRAVAAPLRGLPLERPGHGGH